MKTIPLDFVSLQRDSVFHHALRNHTDFEALLTRDGLPKSNYITFEVQMTTLELLLTKRILCSILSGNVPISVIDSAAI